MKKIGILFVCVVLAVAMALPTAVFAADAMTATAKAGDPTVDGKVSDGEYGDAFVLNKDNAASWGGLGALSVEVSFNFAWSSKGLYVAVTYPKAMTEASQIQIDCNPGDQIDAAQQGLFFTITPAGEVLLHNQKTALADATAAPASIKDKVTIASAEDGDLKTTEVLLPIEAFRISDDSFTFAEGTMALSPFVVVVGADGAPAETGAAVSSDLSDWAVGKLGLGTLTLEKGEQTAEPPADNDQQGSGNENTTGGNDKEDNATTGDINWFVPAVFVVAAAAMMLSTLYRRTKAN